MRARFPEMKRCYDDGLKRNPALKGSVTAKAVVGEGGETLKVADGGSTLPDAAVVACVVGEFGKVAYPRTHAGTMTIVYPIEFTP